MDFVLGANSRLGQAIVRSFPNQVVALDRAIYANWWSEGAADAVSFYFERFGNIGIKESIVYLTAGILDPSRPFEEHHNINYLLAKNIIEGANRVGLRTVTFGTIMEKVIGFDTNNPYILSKTRLSDFVTEFSITTSQAPPLHIRLHTLYGVGLPSPFMFLGQLLNSLFFQRQFNMSSGAQLREYHHIDDVVKALARLVAVKMDAVFELNHGSPIALKDLAHYIFKEFNCLELLNIGASTSPAKENYTVFFERPAILSHLSFRETLPAIVNYLRTCKVIYGESICLN